MSCDEHAIGDRMRAHRDSKSAILFLVSYCSLFFFFHAAVGIHTLIRSRARNSDVGTSTQFLRLFARYATGVGILYKSAKGRRRRRFKISFGMLDASHDLTCFVSRSLETVIRYMSHLSVINVKFTTRIFRGKIYFTFYKCVIFPIESRRFAKRDTYFPIFDCQTADVGGGVAGTRTVSRTEARHACSRARLRYIARLRKPINGKVSLAARDERAHGSICAKNRHASHGCARCNVVCIRERCLSAVVVAATSCIATIAIGCSQARRRLRMRSSGELPPR